MKLKLAIALTLAASQASALSCIPTDAAWTYTQAAESEDRYYFVRGALDPEASVAAPGINADGGVSHHRTATARVHLSGHSLTKNGFDQPFDSEINVEISCVSIWCGGAPSGEFIAALRISDFEPILEIGPCGGFVLPAEQKHIDQILACHRGEECKPAF